MTATILLSYLLIIAGILIWTPLLQGRKQISDRTTTYISVFGGAFLFASCFINLVPHMYLEGYVTPVWHFKVGAAVLAGFIVQLLLERLTQGVEHGHTHSHDHSGNIPVAGLLLGLAIHSFLEGMPLADADRDIHQGLLYGIVLHNIPITLVLIGLFINNRYGLLKGAALLMLVAVMTPLGSLCNIYFLPQNETLQGLLMGVVVGILLHVSISILFGSEHNKFSWFKLTLIILAFLAAYFTPGCPEIYG